MARFSNPTNARFFLAFFFACLIAKSVIGKDEQVPLVDGMVIGPGKLSQVQSCSPVTTNNVNAGADFKALYIDVLDDGLRRTYFNSFRRAGEPVQVKESLLEIKLGGNQPASNAQGVPGGPIVGNSPFNLFGRRICIVRTDSGYEKIVQGITEVTPNYVRVDGLKGENGDFVWDTRLSLNSFDSKLLSDVLVQNASPNKSDDWLQIVNLFRASKRFVEARAILVRAIQRFPELERMTSELKSLDQEIADQLFSASDAAASVGQYQYSKLILENIKKAGLSIETQLKVTGKLESFANGQKENDELLAWITQDISKVADEAVKTEMQSLLAEIGANLTADTALRFADYRRRRSDPGLKPEQLAALAISGWIFGPASGKDNAAVVAAGIKARQLITTYLAKSIRDDQIVQDLTKLEAGTPELVAQIIANMPPPKPTLDSEAIQTTPATGNPPVTPNGSEPTAPSTIPGRFAIEVPLTGSMTGQTTRYIVQLPPEYNPYRRYPCILAIPGSSSGSGWQVAWWAGDYWPEAKRCLGEASKRGYIVVSPDWAEPKQDAYYYTENEQAKILAPLRDAMRRFSIDTDRVFVSGHFMGADAAWDIALGHPDLWAGSIVVSGEAQKYVVNYWNNSLYVPTYFVCGELDGFRGTNGDEWDKLLKSKRMDSLITIYRGRKPDHFQEELPRMMDWMSFPDRVRKAYPGRDRNAPSKALEFEVTTSRAGDRFFWWFDTTELQAEKLVHPLLHKPGVGYKIKSSIVKESNSIFMETIPAKNYSVWLSPELIDMNQTISLVRSNVKERREPKPETRVILEDVRRRADRQHPFWMRLDVPK